MKMVALLIFGSLFLSSSDLEMGHAEQGKIAETPKLWAVLPEEIHPDSLVEVSVFDFPATEKEFNKGREYKFQIFNPPRNF